jgi:D-serine deaminase-like pyridoxal phosphate-dependent protein
MEKLFKSDLVSVSGLYTHGGDSYHAHNSGEVVTYAQRESISVIECVATPYIVKFLYEEETDLLLSLLPSFAAKLKSLGFEVPVVSVGSTPTCSNPPTEWNQITEIHPGNYALYDVTQASIGSCSFDDNAGFVFARVVRHILRFRFDGTGFLFFFPPFVYVSMVSIDFEL